MNAAGAAAEDHAFYRGVTNELVRFTERVDLAVHVELAHPACNELGVLGTVIEDQNGFWQNKVSCA